MLRSFIFVTFFQNILTINPIVETENGLVSGIFETSYSGQKYKAFKGIPYAKPPINDLRFEAPQKLDDNWIGVWKADSYGNVCTQLTQFKYKKFPNGTRKYFVEGDEDCLYLNIFTTEDGPSNKSVLVHIHGGAFMFGFASFYDPEYIMDRTDIVFVTIHYRVGPLGFLTTGDSAIPGNNGLKDQVAALKWVQRNIANFGGDPQKITLSGHSAGAVSVMLHLVSPQSAGLFQRAILFSGSVSCPWNFITNSVERSKNLAQLLGCPTNDTKITLECLKHRPARKIAEAAENYLVFLYNPFSTFGPTVEPKGKSAFLWDEPSTLIQKGKFQKMPLIFGVTADEGLYPAYDFTSSSILKEINENWETIAPSLLFPRNITKSVLISRRAKEEYLKSKPITKENFQSLVDLLSDRLFTLPIVEDSKLMANAQHDPVYLYKFSFEPKGGTKESDSEKVISGVSHGQDVSYFYKMFIYQRTDTEEVIKMRKNFTKLMMNFIIKGNVPDYWKPLNGSETMYLDIKSPESFEMTINPDFANPKLQYRIFVEEDASRNDEL